MKSFSNSNLNISSGYELSKTYFLGSLYLTHDASRFEACRITITQDPPAGVFEHCEQMSMNVWINGSRAPYGVE